MGSHSLTNAKAGQFISREASYSTRGARTGRNLLGWEEGEELSPEEERACLARKSQSLTDQIVALPKKSKKRRELGLLQQEVCQRMNDIRPKRQQRNLQGYIIEILKEGMTQASWDSVVRRAEAKLARLE